MITNKYTITVTLVDKSVHHFPNMSHDNVETFKKIVWTQGVTIKIDDLHKELVSPYRISQVLIKVQSPASPQQ